MEKLLGKNLYIDALIGNTDRHQDNWGIIVNPLTDEMRISPVFDNGTSMGHEIFSNKFDSYNDDRLKKYIENGWHHMKWKQDDVCSTGHLELLKKLIDKYPEIRKIILTCLKIVNNKTFESILTDLVAFDVPVQLSTEREDFMLKLLQLRHQRLLSELEK